LQHQSRVLGGGELEHEILGKALVVATDLLVEARGADPVERCELGIEQDLVAAEHEDRLRDVLDRHECGASVPGHGRLFSGMLETPPVAVSDN